MRHSAAPERRQSSVLRPDTTGAARGRALGLWRPEDRARRRSSGVNRISMSGVDGEVEAPATNLAVVQTG